jgi:LacI family transcriptional regulator
VSFLLDSLIEQKRRGKSPFANPQTVILPPMGIVSRQSADFFTVDDPLVGRALRVIAENLHRPLEVASVAKAVGTSRRALDDRFRKSLGVTAVAEIMRLRIERVKRDLAAGEDTMDAIARRAGFASTRTLNDQFLRSTGMSPTAFREQGTRPRG